MRVLRTPDDRFVGLAGYGFAPHYVEVPSGDPMGVGADPAAQEAIEAREGAATIRVHHLDEGPESAEDTVVLLHGEPSWSYLYRTMVPPLVAAGHRVVVPDLVGFGRSDKPADRADYTYARHVEWLRAALFDRLDLRDVTLLGQDWGGLLGLRLVAEHPDRFRRVVAANTGLPTGDRPLTEAFDAWRRFSQEVEVMPIGRIVDGGTVSVLSPEVVAAYDAPFPDERFKEGARQFPLLVPVSPDDPAAEANRQAWTVLRAFDRPFLCAFSDGDPITRGAERQFVEEVPGAAGQPHITIEEAGHFLQEDKGEELAAVVVDFIAHTPTG
ncbi:MAG TPA: haloalkane dehalogenase [Acidimicrobiales bacterium]|nr:haloalkane dehalogenase [Acidimicrobiales bacterium]